MKNVNKLEDIPKECYGVLSVDPKTGIPLNENGKWCTQNEGFLYFLIPFRKHRTTVL